MAQGYASQKGERARRESVSPLCHANAVFDKSVYPVHRQGSSTVTQLCDCGARYSSPTFRRTDYSGYGLGCVSGSKVFCCANSISTYTTDADVVKQMFFLMMLS